MHVPKGTNKIYSHFKLDCNKSNQSVSQINKTIIPNRWGCIEKGMSIWGLARYSVKMTATSGPFLKATTKPWNYLYGVFSVSSWLIGSGFYKKNQRSHITNHTSHIIHHTFHIRKLTICLCIFYNFLTKISYCVDQDTFNPMSYIPHSTSHITHHTLQITLHISHITENKSFICFWKSEAEVFCSGLWLKDYESNIFGKSLFSSITWAILGASSYPPGPLNPWTPRGRGGGVSVLLSASVKRVSVSPMRDFFQVRFKIKCDKKSENMHLRVFLIRLKVGSQKRKKKI